MAKAKGNGGKTGRRKGWWARFVERMARANEERLKQGCPT